MSRKSKQNAGAVHYNSMATSASTISNDVPSSTVESDRMMENKESLYQNRTEESSAKSPKSSTTAELPPVMSLSESLGTITKLVTDERNRERTEADANAVSETDSSSDDGKDEPNNNDQGL